MRRVEERTPGLGRIQFEEMRYVSVGGKPDLPAGTKLAWYSEDDTAVYDVEVEWAFNPDDGHCKVRFAEPGPDGAEPGDTFRALLSDLFWHPPEGAKPMAVFRPMRLEWDIHCDRGCNKGLRDIGGQRQDFCPCVRSA